MATKAAGRSLQLLTRRSRTNCQSYASTNTAKRQISASSSRSEADYETEKESRPRWSFTPPAMKAPFRHTIKDPDQEWVCNEDPVKLDQFYKKFLGRDGETMLEDEIKWLAVTHKSYDQGRRGFNDRLAFLGRRIINVQTTLAVLHNSVTGLTPAPEQPRLRPAGDDRIPFQNPALAGLNNLNETPIAEILTKRRLGGLATQMGLRDVLRWKPRMAHNVEKSGIDVVLTSTMYAIIGAISLQKGTAVANRITNERILKPLGIL